VTSDRPAFVVTLKAMPGVDPVIALRLALKVLRRAFGLQCVSIRRDAPLLEQSSQGDVANVVRAHEQALSPPPCRASPTAREHGLRRPAPLSTATRRGATLAD
jgi:hypothetical protein